MTLPVVPNEHDLRQIAEQVWASYIDMDGDRPLVPEPVKRPPRDVYAAVSVTGAWHGRVVVVCSAAASRQAAAALLGVAADDVTPVDVGDAMGEIANVIGGNIKSLLPEPCALSLPEVRISADDIVRWRVDDEVCRFEATWLGEPLAVSVLEEHVGHAEGAV